jgi:crossover junction endodeoxyribonuclease RusA
MTANPKNVPAAVPPGDRHLSAAESLPASPVQALPAAPGAPAEDGGSTRGPLKPTSGADHPSAPLVASPASGNHPPLGAEGGLPLARVPAAGSEHGSRGTAGSGAPVPGPALSSRLVPEGAAGRARGEESGAPTPSTALPPATDPEGVACSDPAAPSGPILRQWAIEFPAGLQLLSMNGREHHMARHRKAQALKDAAIVMTRKARVPRLERIRIAVYYDPPDRRHRDHDNLFATAKHLSDGIVKAGVVPDDTPEYVVPGHCEITDTVVPRGRLRMVITEVPGGAA